jgi:hypothetical protein
MLVTDRAGAMRAANVKPSRLAVAQRAARNFLDRLPREIRVGVVAFSDIPDCPPSADHDDARRIIDGQIADGATDIGDDPQVGISGLRRDRQNGKRAPVANVLLSDDKTTTGRDLFEVGCGAGRPHNPSLRGRRSLSRPDPETQGADPRGAGMTGQASRYRIAIAPTRLASRLA